MKEEDLPQAVRLDTGYIKIFQPWPILGIFGFGEEKIIPRDQIRRYIPAYHGSSHSACSIPIAVELKSGEVVSGITDAGSLREFYGLPQRPSGISGRGPSDLMKSIAYREGEDE